MASKFPESRETYFPSVNSACSRMFKQSEVHHRYGHVIHQDKSLVNLVASSVSTGDNLKSLVSVTFSRNGGTTDEDRNVISWTKQAGWKSRSRIQSSRLRRKYFVWLVYGNMLFCFR